MKTSQYMVGKHNQANEEFLGMDGYGDEWGNFDAEDLPLDAGQLPADGGMNAPNRSEPYIVQVKNTTSTDVDDVVILDAANRFSDFTVASISLSYLSNLTYGEFLARLLNISFKVGQTRFEASGSTQANREAQVITTLKVETKNLSGDAVTRQLNFLRDNYANQNAQTDNYTPYYVDSSTKLTIGTVYANTTLKIYFFPSGAINPMEQLKQGAGTRRYTNPRTNPALAR